MKPILFKTEMIRAILDGKKTQTRRVIKPQPIVDYDSGYVYWKKSQFDIHGMPLSIELPKLCPYGTEGDILYVRETWLNDNHIDGKRGYCYKADFSNTFASSVCWAPSLFMPKEAARIYLEIKEVRVERLQNISANSAISEGISLPNYAEQYIKDVDYPTPPEIFCELWDSINGKKYSWSSNPFVWVIEFEQIDNPEK